MKTTLDIITVMYNILNVSTVTDLLDGSLEKHKRRENTPGKRDISIVPLANVKTEDVVSQGVLFVNIYCPTLSNNMVNDTVLNPIVKVVMEKIEAYVNATNYYNFEIINQSTDAESRDETQVNLRIGFYFEH